jgi:hypothetical protein
MKPSFLSREKREPIGLPERLGVRMYEGERGSTAAIRTRDGSIYGALLNRGLEMIEVWSWGLVDTREEQEEGGGMNREVHRIRTVPTHRAYSLY